MSFWSGKRVLVTGGAGFLGSHLVEMLVAEGARVRVPHRRADAPWLAAVRGQIDLLVGDLADAAFCRQAVDEQAVVLHLAAHVGGIHYNRAHHASLFQQNMVPFLNVLEAVRASRPERLLITSSACVYPHDARVPTPEEEGTRDGPEPTNGGYGWAKRLQEYVGAAAAEEYGLSVAIARPFNAYGPRDDFRPETSHVIPGLIRRILGGEDPLVVWGTGSQTRTFLYARDFARGLMLVAERHAVARPLNLGSDEETSIRALVELILEISGRRPEVRFDTARPEGQRRRACDTTRMAAALGWSPATPLREGLRETIRWFEEQDPG